ncbi:MAG: flavin-containing monooxygenase [Panacagrimonas sp.]
MSPNQKERFEFVIVGSGISGISAALTLRRNDFDDFVVVEAADQPGGVWRENTYPGIACDIPSILYQFKSDKNPDWSQLYAGGAEIMRYLRSVQARNRIDRKTRYGIKITKAEFDESRSMWHLTADNGQQLECRYLIKATGAFNSVSVPRLQGMDDFHGDLFHTARWPKKLDLQGKRVAVIGNGASAIQLVPLVAEQASQLSVYQRTPIWLLPKADLKIAPIVRRAFSNVPGLYALSHKLSYRSIEFLLRVLLVTSGKHPRTHKFLEAAGRWNIRHQLDDPELISKFMPDYSLGCKRPSFSNNYYRTFTKPHVRLITDGIQKLTTDGILRKGADKPDPYDVIVMATGFNILDEKSTALPAFPVIGRAGKNLRSFWHETDGFKAFRGASVPGFPNLFLNLGIPYAGGTSWFETADMISAHITHCVGVAKQRGLPEIEVKPEAVDEYMQHVAQLLVYSVHYTGNCATSNSYYYDKHGNAPLYTAEPPDQTWEKGKSSVLGSYVFRAAGAGIPASPLNT